MLRSRLSRFRRWTRRAGSLLTVLVALVTGGARVDAAEVVRFSTGHRLLGALTARASDAPPAAETIQGYLTRPVAAGRHPAAVLLTGCAGLSGSRFDTDPRSVFWTDRLMAQGYVVLVVDTLTSRGLGNDCLDGGAQEFRAADAFGALAFLAEQDFVDAGKVALVGFSAGGRAALTVTTTVRDAVSYQEQTRLHYRAAVAFYPPRCAVSASAAVPVLIVVGERDDWSSAAECRRMLADDGDGKRSLIVYPDAYHDFDDPSLGYGQRSFDHWREYNRDATLRAVSDVTGFLRQQLGN